jgi:hypothetical protein
MRDAGQDHDEEEKVKSWPGCRGVGGAGQAVGERGGAGQAVGRGEELPRLSGRGEELPRLLGRGGMERGDGKVEKVRRLRVKGEEGSEVDKYGCERREKTKIL